MTGLVRVECPYCTGRSRSSKAVDPCQECDNGTVLVANWPSRRVAICPTRTPELHELGEFPMSCYRCHLEADS